MSRWPTLWSLVKPGMSEDTFQKTVAEFLASVCKNVQISTPKLRQNTDKLWQTMTNSAWTFPIISPSHQATSVCSHPIGPIGPIGHTRPAYTILRNHLPTFWSRGFKRKVPSTFEQFELLLINSLSSLIERVVRKHQEIDKVQPHLKTTHWHQSMQLKH